MRSRKTGFALGKLVLHWEILQREARFIVFMHTCTHEGNIWPRGGIPHWQHANQRRLQPLAREPWTPWTHLRGLKTAFYSILRLAGFLKK